MGQGGREELAELAVGRRKGTRSLRIALLITVLFMLVEFVGGLWTNSLALLADAGHMLTDAAALSLSLFAVGFILRPATPEKTYGYFREWLSWPWGAARELAPCASHS